MSAKVKLETHQIEIRKRGDKNSEPLNLWDIDGNKLTINNIFLKYLEWLDTAEYADKATKKVFDFDGSQAELSKTSCFQSGRFEYGEYGVANQIKNVITRKVTHKKTGDESEVYPLYFLLYAPEGEKQGVFVLQRYGHIAMLTQLKNTLNKFMAENYHEYMAVIEPLTPIEILREYIENGDVDELILRRKDIPDDEADRLMEGGLATKPDGIAVRITGDGIIGKDTLYKWLDDEHATYVVQDLANVGLDGAHRTTVKINVNGTPREIDFSDTGKIRPYIDIHADYLLDKSTGHPIFEEINRIAKKYATDILSPNNEKNKP